ncbi:MAG TPA: CoA pyrophosphatase [Candidatus Limnocylindrales bacterium]|nr:CoA pyrophosphatase [Candidatus Limnocylindrales bacterium]
MRFEVVRARLASLPDPLPQPPAALAPLLVAGPTGQLGLPPAPPGGAMRTGAVLVLLYPDAEGMARVVLTERPAGDLRHAGEVSFPGGVLEDDDASPAEAALREAREEVGLDAAQAGVRLVGELGPVEVRVTGFRILPVLAMAERAPRLVPDPREVAAILEPPVASFVPPAPIELVEDDRGGWRLRYGAYPVAGYRIWGATARILGQLGAVIAAAGRGGSSDPALESSAPDVSR